MTEPISALDKECFFIAPIGKEGSADRNRSDGVLEFIISRAAQELELTAVRADQIGEPGQITLQVIDHILGARAAVADLTGLNANVFYELAVRHTARLPVALIAEKGCQLPFDIAQMRTIFFDHTDLRSADQCRRDIVKQLREALGGAVDSPIATSVDVRALQSGTAVERNLAELVTTVESLASNQRQDSRFIQRIYRDIRTRDHTLSPAALRDIVSGIDRLSSLASERNDPQLFEILSEINAPLRFLIRNSDLEMPPRLLTRKPSNSVSELPSPEVVSQSDTKDEAADD